MNADQPAPDGTPAAASDLLIASTLQSLDTRLQHLEKPREKTLSEKIQKNASLLALVIGIFLSLISLFDIFWSKPREALLRDMEEFNRSVNAVTSLRQNLVQVQFQSNNPNPEMMFALSSMATPQILAHIQYATTLLPRLGDRAGIPQLMVLIYEAMNIYDWKSAGILVDQAMATKDAVPSMQSEVRRYRGRLMFLTGKVQDGRQSYEDAINALRNESSFGINGNRAYIVSDWVVAEFAMGDCSVGKERIRQFIEYARHPEISQPARRGLVSSLKSQIGQIQSQNPRCPPPNELLAL